MPAAAAASPLCEIGPELYFTVGGHPLHALAAARPRPCRVWDRVLSKASARSSAPPSRSSPSSSPALAAASFDDAVRLLQHLPPIDGDELLPPWEGGAPEEEYEALLVDAIVNGATPDNYGSKIVPSELTYSVLNSPLTWVAPPRRASTRRRRRLERERRPVGQVEAQRRHPRPPLEVDVLDAKDSPSRFLVTCSRKALRSGVGAASTSTIREVGGRS